MVKRSGSIVFADSKRTAGVAANLVVPRYTHDDKDWSIGGVMCVPLKALVISGKKYDLSSAGVVLGIDTGSEGFFVIDDTGGGEGSAQESVTQKVAPNNQSMGDGFGDYELIIETRDGGEFIIRSPEQWRMREHTEVIRRRPFRTNEPAGPEGKIGSVIRSQMFMVGNAWLQAIAVTFCPRSELVYFAHLDQNGQRAKNYLGPRSPPQALPSSSSSSVAALSASTHLSKLPPFWHGIGYLGVSLTEIPHPVTAPEASPSSALSSAPPSTDLELPISFMVSSRGARGGSSDERVESTDPSLLSEPCLSATFPTIGGGTRKVTQVLDTGSGISIVMGGTTTPKVSVSADDCPECGCVGTGGKPTDLASLFRAYNPDAESPKRCENPPRDAQCGQGCCSQCCMGAEDVEGNPLRPNTQIRCAVSYCTGMLQYSPSFAAADFSPTFKNIKVFLARGSPVCEPAVGGGLWGCWSWANKEKKKKHGNEDDVIHHSSTLPFYILRAMQQETGEMSNMTFKFWRSDLERLDGADLPSPPLQMPIPPPPLPLPMPIPPLLPPPLPTPITSPPPLVFNDNTPKTSPPNSSPDNGGRVVSSKRPRRENGGDDSLAQDSKSPSWSDFPTARSGGGGGGSSVSWATVGLVMVVVCSLLFALAMLASLWRIGNHHHVGADASR
jgi:hypothetical protein